MEASEIGIPIKTPESLVPRDSLVREVLKVQDSISNFFRTEGAFFSRVKGIEVKEWGGRNDTKGINCMGVFRKGRVKLYLDAISSEGEPLGEILAHELGHAFCHELRARRGEKKRLFGTSNEAFAEWITVVYKHGGNVQRVDSFFSGYFLKNKKLFASGITHSYPDDYAKMQDAALLHYIYRSDGLDQVINYQ